MVDIANDDGGRRGIPWRIAAWAAATIILLVPLVAMQFTDEVKWGAFDFVFMGVLLFGTLAVYEAAVRMAANTAYRIAVGVALTAVVLLVWMNGAVGIIGDGPINALYIGVLAVGIIGALVARFQAAGLVRTLLAMAIAQMLVPVTALVIWKAGWEGPLMDLNSPHPPFAPGVVPVFGLNAIFAMAFVASALLFRQAARRELQSKGG